MNIRLASPFRTALVVLLVGLQTACAFKPVNEARQKEFEPAKPKVVTLPRKDNGAIYQYGMRVGLFDRVTAKAVGDIVTVILKENTNASSTANTNATKDQKVELPGPTLAGNKVTKDGVEVLENNVDAGREFSGQGTSAQSSSFSGKISVTVAEVLANGNLVVRGQKLMLLNQSDEFIRLTGIVRPEDIRPDNSVDSYRLANVQLAYSGRGAISAANSMGPLARFFQSPLWPY
jgi:flagellar L-ring protein precursor FlgH